LTQLSINNKSASEKLLAAKDTAQQQLDVHHGTLDNLEELGEIMTEMLQRQEQVEARGARSWL
jgi:autophagy-related protein 17